MSDPKYNVILEGTVKPDRQRSEVVDRLSGIFRKDRDSVEKLLSGKPRMIRRGIDLEAARKYLRVIDKAGAACRLEPIADPASVTASPSDDAIQPTDAALRAEPCPRCGYTPAGPDDVMIVRGDCPRCGLMVRGSVKPETAAMAGEVAGEDSAEETVEVFGEDVGADSASIQRRVLASIYTFGCFLIVYCVIVSIFILSFIPLVSVPRYVAGEFLVAAYTVAPSLMTAISILIVSFFVPLLKEGRTWGQRAFSIDLLYTAEAQSVGLVMSLAFRAGAVLLLTLAPGLLVVLGVPEGALDKTAWMEPAVMAVMALAAWSLSWLVCLMSDSRRSLLDYAGGTVQTEIGVMPPHSILRGLGPLLLVGGVLGILGVVSYALTVLGR